MRKKVVPGYFCQKMNISGFRFRKITIFANLSPQTPVFDENDPERHPSMCTPWLLPNNNSENTYLNIKSPKTYEFISKICKNTPILSSANRVAVSPPPLPMVWSKFTFGQNSFFHLCGLRIAFSVVVSFSLKMRSRKLYENTRKCEIRGDGWSVVTKTHDFIFSEITAN